MQENNSTPEDNTKTSLEKLVSKIDQLVSVLPIRQVNLNDQLWELNDIAAWFKLAPATVYRFVITRPDFPAPIQPCGSDSSQKRWFVGEVIKWGKLNQSKLPKPRRGRPRKQ